MSALDAGSISVGLYRHEVGDVTRSCELAALEALAAERAGFDGVTFSEHHLGHTQYFPNPVLTTAYVLGHTTRIWAGPMPMLLTLRPAASTVEDLAWLNAMYPGRVAAGVAAGNAAEEFALSETDGTVVDAFARRLAVLSRCLIGPGDDAEPLLRDPAVQAARGAIPLVSAARSRTAITRAARLGLGILQSPISSAENMARFTQMYEEAGGSGRRVLIYGAWLVAPGTESARYEIDDHAAGWTAVGSGAEVLDRIARMAELSRADAVNVRLHAPGATTEAVQEQLERFGTDVLDDLRKVLGG